MADIHIERQHGMSMAQARKAAFKWAEQAEEKFDMECTYEEGATLDEVSFKRSGVNGTLTVTKDTFELQAKLGFLLGAFKEKIESEIVKNLDALIAKGHKAGATGATGATPAKKVAAKKPATKNSSPRKA
ncbi:MAG: polyhydroxyalkanoic acid system family protein [Polaromonas sp.]|nr:polyhydroxyalkanoic acid system family protein [Polaromonas sp.]